MNGYTYIRIKNPPHRLVRKILKKYGVVGNLIYRHKKYKFNRVNVRDSMLLNGDKQITCIRYHTCIDAKNIYI